MSAASSPLGEASRAYLRLWRGVPREALALIVAVPFAVVGATTVGLALVAALGLIGVLIGVVLVPVALIVARFFARGTRWLDLLAGRPDILEPRARRAPAGVAPATFALYGPVIDGHYWLALLHTLVVAPLLATVLGAVLALWLWAGVGTLVTALDGTGGGSATAARWVADRASSLLGVPGPPEILVVLAAVAVVVLFVSTLPFATRGLTLARYLVDRLLLGPWSSEALQREVEELSASRGAAVAAEDRELRRLERDIHDGPQQRLLRVQMDLASAERLVGADPEGATALIAQAREHVGAALDELRALSRGVAPPILQDRGFEAAVHSIAALSPVPVDVVVDRPIGGVPPEVERSVYFVVAELLANASKHARARRIRVHLDVRDPVPSGESWLDVWVIDDGVGGAAAVSGHGLEGIEGRLRGLRGVLRVDSPAGGPTTVGVHVPFRPLVADASALG